MEATKGKVESAEANKARDSQSLVSLKQQYAQLNDKARKARCAAKHLLPTTSLPTLVMQFGNRDSFRAVVC